MQKLVRVAKTTLKDVADDNVLTHAAALSFYTALSLPPLLVLLLWGLGNLSDSAESYLRNEFQSLMGADGARFIDSILDSSDRTVSFSGLSGIVGTLTLLFAATGIFGQLQLALNRIWEVEAKPGGGIWGLLRKRLLSLAIVGLLAFLAAVSLAASAFVGALDVGGGAVVGRILNWTLSLVVFTTLFATVYKFLPDVRIRWRDALTGAVVTAVLFTVGKFLIGLYLAHQALGADYGAAGSAVVALVWVYYSAAIVLVGAEATQAWMRASGRHIEPDEHARRIGEDLPRKEPTKPGPSNG